MDAASMRLVTAAERIRLAELAEMAEVGFGELVKGVVDVQQRIMVIGGELHADEERLLLEGQSSRPEELWGINLYPDQYGDEGWLEFDSMINVRPKQHNRSRSVEDPKLREIIVEIVDELVTTDD